MVNAHDMQWKQWVATCPHHGVQPFDTYTPHSTIKYPHLYTLVVYRWARFWYTAILVAYKVAAAATGTAPHPAASRLPH